MIALLAMLLFAPAPAPQSLLLGNWATPDSSLVKVYPCESNHLCIRILTIALKDVPRVDAQNPDNALKTRKLCNLQIGTGFTADGEDKAKDGKIYDPKSGHTYSAMMTEKDDVMKLRGFVGISLLGRTETWHRVTGEVPECK